MSNMVLRDASASKNEDKVGKGMDVGWWLLKKMFSHHVSKCRPKIVKCNVRTKITADKSSYLSGSSGGQTEQTTQQEVIPHERKRKD